MTKNEALNDINGTIDQIGECVRLHADNGSDAEYIANSVEQWLDQLRCDIAAYNDAEDDENVGEE